MATPQTSATPATGKVLDPYIILQQIGVKQGMRVADFGCGHGHFVFPAAEIVGNRGSVFAVDLQHELLHAIENHAKSQGLINVKTVWADLEELGSTKIPAGVLDMVLLVNNHVNGATQKKIMQEAVRTLKRGGHVIVIEWLEGNTVPFAPAITERIARDVSMANATSLGLRYIDEFRPGRYHYGLRFLKA